MLQYAKRHSGCDSVVCVMSGNFTQRGEPAMLNKYERAKHAVLAGADAVLELPLPYAVSSAQDFAYGGIRLLQQIGCDVVAFGAETDDLSLLEQAAAFTESADVKRYLSQGLSYPQATAKALEDQGNDVLNGPNNLLAMEYLKACKRLRYTPQFLVLKREGAAHNDKELQQLPSSRAIREALQVGTTESLQACVPEYVFRDLPKTTENHYREFVFTLFQLLTEKDLKAIRGMTEGLENRILQAARNADNYDEFFRMVKTKRYTQLKLQRLFLAGALRFTDSLYVKAQKTTPFAIFLAMNESRKKELLAYFSKKIRFADRLTKQQKELDCLRKRADAFYFAVTNKKKENYSPFPVV